MWYIVWRSEGRVMGFIEDEDERPVSFDSKQAAMNSMVNHALENQVEYIQL